MKSRFPVPLEVEQEPNSGGKAISARTFPLLQEDL